jgi:hypothetical protein
MYGMYARTRERPCSHSLMPYKRMRQPAGRNYSPTKLVDLLDSQARGIFRVVRRAWVLQQMFQVVCWGPLWVGSQLDHLISDWGGQPQVRPWHDSQRDRLNRRVAALVTVCYFTAAWISIQYMIISRDVLLWEMVERVCLEKTRAIFTLLHFHCKTIGIRYDRKEVGTQ